MGKVTVLKKVLHQVISYLDKATFVPLNFFLPMSCPMFDQQIWQILKAALDKQFSPIKSRKTSEPMQPTPEKNQQTSSKLTAATQTVCQRIDQLDSNYKKGALMRGGQGLKPGTDVMNTVSL